MMKYLKKIGKKLYNNKLLFVTSILALISIILGRFDHSFIDFDVILTLFGMMVVIAVFDKSNILKNIAAKLVDYSANTRRLLQIIIGFSFVSSFVLSNDVTVLTILPLYLTMMSYLPEFKGRILGAALIPIAANMGGIFFPFSNPQNLIIYETFDIDIWSFISVTGPIMIVGLILVMATTRFIGKKKCKTSGKKSQVDKSLVIQGSVGMAIMVLCVFNVIRLEIGLAIVLLFTLIKNPKILKRVDYPLLLTFIGFFIITGNLGEIRQVQVFVEKYFSHKLASYLAGIGLSQMISNVPTTMLLISFVDSARTLLMGVNIGGLGTILASLTNLIAYGLYAEKKPSEAKKFLKIFFLANFSILIIMTGIFIFFV